MGMWLLQSWGEVDTAIIEEIAKVYKVDVKVVEKHYKEMIENVKKEVESA